MTRFGSYNNNSKTGDALKNKCAALPQAGMLPPGRFSGSGLRCLCGAQHCRGRGGSGLYAFFWTVDILVATGSCLGRSFSKQVTLLDSEGIPPFGSSPYEISAQSDDIRTAIERERSKMVSET